MQRSAPFLDNNACAICQHCNFSEELNTLATLLQEALQQNVSVCVCVCVGVDKPPPNRTILMSNDSSSSSHLLSGEGETVWK